MALLFRTKYGSFSVKDGYCNGVFDAENARVYESPFQARKLQGVVREQDIRVEDLLPVEHVLAGESGPCRLVFGESEGRVITDVITQFEDQPERLVSLPPPPRSAQKKSYGRVPTETLDLLFPNSIRLGPSSK